MANNTEEFWDINGVSLHQYGWSVTTVGGTRYSLPPKRGTNITLAYRPGQIPRRKLPDSRPISLVMFMVGWNPATGQDSIPLPGQEVSQRTQWNDNWDSLRRLVWENYLADGLVTLTRRWRLSAPVFPVTRTGDSIIAGDPGTPPSGAARILVANAAAEVTGDMAPTMTGRFRSDFQIDLNLPDPYFYGAWVESSVNPDQTIYVWNDGHDVAAHANMEVRFVGPLTKPRVRNLSVSPTNLLVYNGNIHTGKTVTLNVGRFTAVEHDTGDPPTATSTNNRVGLVSSSGARLWFNVLPGANKISSNVEAGGFDGGHVEVRFRPPYI